MQKPTQVSATHAALHGSAFERLNVGTRALLQVLRNPNDTEQVLILGLVAGRSRFPLFLTRFLLTDDGASLLSERPAIDSKHVDFAWLRSLPEGTLGRAYIDFVDREKIDPDFFQPPPNLPAVPTYISQRMRQTHDLWHVVTGYHTDVAGELALQAFTYGQTDMPPPLLVSVFGSMRFGIEDRRIFKMTFDGFRRGRRASFLPSVRWEDRWTHALADVRLELGIEDPRVEAIALERRLNAA